MIFYSAVQGGVWSFATMNTSFHIQIMESCRFSFSERGSVLGRVRGGRPPQSRCRWMRRRRRSWWSRRGRWSRPHRSPRGTKQRTFLIQLKNGLVVWDLLWLRAGDGPSFPNFYCTVHNLVFYHCTCWVPTFSSFLTGKIWRLKVVYFSFVLTLRGKFSLQFQDTCRPFPNMASLGYSLTWPALAIP